MTKRPSRATPEAPPPAPSSLRECLAPLAAAALQSSMLAYQWGLKNRSLMRASMVMALAEDIAAQCARLTEHEDSAQGVARDVAAQMEAGAKGGAKEVSA